MPWGRISAGPFGNRHFRRLWSGQTISVMGSAASPVALTMAVVTRTGSASVLGLVLAVYAGSQVAFMLVGGVWADRIGRREIMIVADTVRCAAQTAIGVQIVDGVINIPSLAAASFVTGTASAFFNPASYGLLPDVVEPGLLRRANALLSVGRRTAMLVGPAIATGAALTLGPGWAVLLDGATFGVNAVTLLAVRISPVARTRTSVLADIREGWREVRSRRWFLANVLVHGVWNFARCAYFTVGAAVVITGDGGDVGWGAITEAATAGAFLGALVALRFKPGRPLVVSNLCLALGALPLLGIALGLPVAVICVAAVMMNGVLGLMDTLWTTTVQQRIPEHLMSKVGAYDGLVSLALNPAGMAVMPSLAALLGPRPVLFAAAFLILSSSLGVLTMPEVRAMGHQNSDDAVPVHAGT